MGWLADGQRVVRAVLTNQLARVAPTFYVRWTGETGRGLGAESAGQAADYFRRCYDEYFAVLGLAEAKRAAFLAGKRLLEYGPGDVPGVALLMIAGGSASVTCVDRFPLLNLDAKNVAVLRDLLAGLQGGARLRAAACFVDAGVPESGFDPRRIRYHIDRAGLSHETAAFDFVYSRAVLEHVNDLDATFADMHRAMKPGAIAIHQVDLKSHGLHRDNPLDFLCWPEPLWRIMYDQKGVPNRLRVDSYRRLLDQHGFEVLHFAPTLRADPAEVAAIRPCLARPFRDLGDEDLAWLGFWMVVRKKAD